MRTLLLPVSVALFIAPAARAPESGELGAFAVTSRKRAQTTTDVPNAVTARPSEFLKRAGVTEFKRLASSVPGLCG